jgi:hypothetical protein
MRKITAIAVALGFLTSVSLPAFATPAVNGVVKSDELSAAKKKKKKDSMEKKSSLGVTDLSAAKKKKKDSMEKVQPEESLQEEKEEGLDGEEVQPSARLISPPPRRKKKD